MVEELVLALSEGDENKVNDCVCRGADIDADNTTGTWKVLHYACFLGHLHIIKLLIEKYGANVEAIDYNGRTALHIACKYGHLEVAQYLVDKAGVDVKAKNYVGINALHLASRYGHLSIVQYLVEICNIDASLTTNWGLTACEIARGYEELKVEEYLRKQPNSMHTMVADILKVMSTIGVKRDISA